MPDTVKLSVADIERIYQAANESTFRGTGAGSFYGQFQAVLRGIDRFGYNVLPANAEFKGLTFITRPKLNLTTTSLRQNRILMSLATDKPDTLPFTIRCLLDTRYASRKDIIPRTENDNAPFLNNKSPFITPLTNCLVNISGWPDPVIDTETTEGGFHSENLTFAKGSDRLAGSYDFSLVFRDIQGGVILALIYIWTTFIDLVTKGNVVPYSEDIDLRRLCYTCSIYRFVLDPSKRYITKWAKATGCFPKSIPLGPAFNVNEGEIYISSTATYSVPFAVNKVEYMDPMIFRDFNRLVERFNSDINTDSMVDIPIDAEYNYKGIPYVDTVDGLNELKFRGRTSDLVDPMDRVMQEITDRLKRKSEDEELENNEMINPSLEPLPPGMI